MFDADADVCASDYARGRPIGIQFTVMVVDVLEEQLHRAALQGDCKLELPACRDATFTAHADANVGTSGRRVGCRESRPKRRMKRQQLARRAFQRRRYLQPRHKRIE